MDLFDLLPNEILVEILGQIISPQNLLSLKLVCRRFKQIVECVCDPNELEGKHFRWNVKRNNVQEVARLLQDERILNNMNHFEYFYYMVIYSDLPLIASVIDEPRVDPDLYLGESQFHYHPLIRSYLYGKMDVFDFLLNHPKVNQKFTWDQIVGISLDENRPGLVERLTLAKRVTIDDDYTIDALRRFAITFGSVNLWNFSLGYTHILDHIVVIIEETKQVYNSQVLDEILDYELVQSADISTRFEIYKSILAICCKGKFIDSIHRVLEKGRAIGEWIIDEKTIGDNKGILKLFLKFPDTVVISSWKVLVSFDDIEIIDLCLQKFEDAHFCLFSEAIAQGKKDIAAYILKGENKNLSENVHFEGHDPWQLIKGMDSEMLKFILEELRVYFSKIDCIYMFNLACKSEKEMVLRCLLANDRFNSLLPHSLLKQDVVPCLLHKGKTNIASVISKFIK